MRISKTMGKRAIVFSMMVLLLSSLTVKAQYDGNKYGIQPWFGTSLLGRESSGSNDITNQTFGNYVETDDITNQTFGAPIGNGMLVLLMAGVGYATIKSRKRNNK